MTDGAQPGDQPPLGEPTPALARRRSGSWHGNSFVAAALGLLFGLVAGFGVGRSLGQGSAEETSSKPVPTRPSVLTTTVPPPPTLPADCDQALQSAEEVVQLLEHGFQNLRRLQVDRVEQVVADLGRLRSEVTARVVGCQEQLRR